MTHGNFFMPPTPKEPTECPNHIVYVHDGGQFCFTCGEYKEYEPVPLKEVRMDQRYWHKGTPPEQLMEECAEVIKGVCKSLRFGWHNWHPEDPLKTPNYDLVLQELDDLEKRMYEFRKWMVIHQPKT